MEECSTEALADLRENPISPTTKQQQKQALSTVPEQVIEKPQGQPPSNDNSISLENIQQYEALLEEHFDLGFTKAGSFYSLYFGKEMSKIYHEKYKMRVYAVIDKRQIELMLRMGYFDRLGADGTPFLIMRAVDRKKSVFP